MEQGIVHVKNRVMSQEESNLILQQCPVGRIGSADSDHMPYITPVNYVYEPDLHRIYIHHSCKAGHLLANLKDNSRVCFEVDQPGSIVNTNPVRHICNIDQIFRSVICFGHMSVASDEEKIRGLRLLGSKYSGKPVTSQSDEFDSARLERLVVLVIGIEKMTGKCREPQP